MGRRTITEGEIALVKAMLNREMKNKNIQFFFNRPDRPVNSGRISTIRTGSYSNSKDIPAASDSELDTFIHAFPPSPTESKLRLLAKFLSRLLPTGREHSFNRRKIRVGF